MELDYLVLADAAAAAEGKHYIHGGGWDTLFAATYPVVHPKMAIAVRLRVPWNATNHAHRIEVDVVDEDGNSILPNPPGPLRGEINVGRPPTIPVGADQFVPLVFDVVGLQFPQEGSYAVILRIDGLDMARYPVRLMTPPGIRQPPAQ